MRAIHFVRIATALVAATTASLCLADPAAPTASVGTRLEASRDPLTFRSNVLRLTEEYQGIVDRYGLPSFLGEQLAQAHDRLAQAPGAQFAEAVTQLGANVDQLLSTTDALVGSLAVEHRHAQREAPGLAPPGRLPEVGYAVTSTGFPQPDYPNVAWDFVVHVFSDPPSGEAADQTRSGLCTTPRMSDNLLFLSQNAMLVNEATRDIAGRICEQDAAGVNLSIVCIIEDVLFIVQKGIFENLMLCEDLISTARNDASFERLDHIHTDVGNARTSIENTVNAGTAAIVNDVDATRNALLAIVRTGQDFTLRVEIEKALRDDERLAIFFLPEARGGHLELARQIVMDVIQAVLSAGQTVNAANARLAAGDADSANGNWKRAFHWYSQAYFEAVKLIGDTQ